MTRIKIIVHCLVKNEERFIWYAIKSVLPFVDKIMVWDTGSTDKTIQIIKSIKSKKISLSVIPSHPLVIPSVVEGSLSTVNLPATGIPPLEDSVGMTERRILGRNDREENTRSE
ncbi:hypothetical protein KKA49_00135 [Patescibacteria group bacterium]|nr:hypothetical protein [Patescibacteria group bacterium]MBU1457616.1 hypothetical protein [Patescibacteria group bacterium]